jgi:hypothetical protein
MLEANISVVADYSLQISWSGSTVGGFWLFEEAINGLTSGPFSSFSTMAHLSVRAFTWPNYYFPPGTSRQIILRCATSWLATLIFLKVKFHGLFLTRDHLCMYAMRKSFDQLFFARRLVTSRTYQDYTVNRIILSVCLLFTMKCL